MIRLKKWISWILAACLLLSLTACGEQTEETPSSEVTQPGMEESEPVTVTNEETQNTSGTDREHILIVYFSWADNTVVEDEEAAVQSALSHYDSIGDSENYSDVDAVASASVVAPGNTARLAQWIQEYVGGDLFPIVVAETYPDDYEECLDRAADEKAESCRQDNRSILRPWNWRYCRQRKRYSGSIAGFCGSIGTAWSLQGRYSTGTIRGQ